MIAATTPTAVRPAKGWMEVFSLVCVEGQAVPDAAAKLRLRPEKVRQTRDQVLAWLAKNQPLLSGVSREEGLRLSEAVARERLEHLYALAMEAWENSMEDEVTTRQEGILAKTTRIVKRSHGKISYLQMAMKISDQLRAIPIQFLPGWMEEGAEADAEVDFQLDAGERYAREQQRRSKGNASAVEASHPPVRACSPEATYLTPGTSELLNGFDTMLNETRLSAEAMERFRHDSELRARLFTPVQTDEGEGDEELSEADDAAFAAAAEQVLERPVQLEEAAPSLQPKQVRRPLSRKERRARQRLLEKAKRKRSG